MRWSIVSLFLIGWLLTVGSFHGLPLEYTLLALLSLASCALLLFFLDGPFRPNLPIWIVLSVFLVNYYLKFYAIVLFPDILETPGSTGALGCTIPPAEDVLFFTYWLTTCAFVTFCLVAVPFAATSRRAQGDFAGFAGSTTPQPRIGLAVVCALLLIAANVLVTSAVNFTRGQDATLAATMPFHSVAVVVVFIPSVIVMLSLTVFEYGLETGHRGLTIAGLGLLFANALTELLLVTGKAAIAYAALALVAFWLVTGRKVQIRHTLFVVGCFLLTAILYPFVIAIRSLRLVRSSMNLSSAVSLIFSVGGGGKPLTAWGSQMTSLLYIAQMIFMRLTGAEFTLLLIDHHAAPLGWTALDLWKSGRLLDQYAAIEIFGLPEGPMHRPIINTLISLVGFFYLIGGAVAVVAGVFAFMLLVFGAYRWLASCHFAGQSAFLAFFLTTVLFYRVIGGDLDYQLSRGLPFYIAAGVLTECVLVGPLRMMFGARSRPRRRPDPFAQNEAGLTSA